MTTPIEPAERVHAATAAKWLPPGDEVRTLLATADGNVGLAAPWPRDAILALFRDAGFVMIAGPRARAMGYGLAVWMREQGRLLFVESAVPTEAIRYPSNKPVGQN